MKIFTKSQFQRLANILENAGQVVFASVVIPKILSGNIFSWEIGMTYGIITMTIFWWWALRLERRHSRL